MELHVILGTGAVGTALAHHLTSQGKIVRSVNRSRERGSLPASVELVKADLDEAAQASAAMNGASVTYQITQPAYHRWAEEFPALQAGIIDAAAAAGTSLVIVDNLYPYGDHDGAVISEESAEQAHTKKGAVRRELAKAALEAHRAGRLKVALLRPAHYFGPGEGLTEKMIMSNALAGKPVQWLGRADLPHSFSYVPDVARALAALGASEDGWGKIWISPVTPPVTVREFAQMAWKASGKDGDVKVSSIRGAGMTLLSIFISALRESKEMMYEWEKPYIVDSSRFEAAFGVTPTPVEDAIRESVEAVRDRQAVSAG